MPNVVPGKTLTITSWISLCATVGFPGGFAIAAGGETASFRQDIAPLLIEHCIACHHEANPEGGYRVDLVSSVGAEGDSGSPPIVPGASEKSELFRRLTSSDVGERMPADNEPLPEEAVERIREWIDSGASLDDIAPESSLETIVPPPRHPTPPETYPVAVPVTALAFSPDGSELAVGGYHEVLVWDVESAVLRRRLGNVGQRVFAIGFPPEQDGIGDADVAGRTVIVASGTPGLHGEIRQLDFDTGETLGVAARSADVATSVAFRPGHRQIAVGSADQKIRIVDLETMETIREIISHTEGVNSVTWNADGSRLASASGDRSVKLFDTDSGHLVHSYRGHDADVRGVVFAADDEHLVSVDQRGKLHRWGVDSAKVTHQVDLPAEPLRMGGTTGTPTVALADGSVLIIDTADLQIVGSLGPASDWALSAAKTIHQERFAVGAFDGEVSLWRADENRAIRRWIANP